MDWVAVVKLDDKDRQDDDYIISYDNIYEIFEMMKIELNHIHNLAYIDKKKDIQFIVSTLFEMGYFGVVLFDNGIIGYSRTLYDLYFIYTDLIEVYIKKPSIVRRTIPRAFMYYYI